MFSGLLKLRLSIIITSRRTVCHAFFLTIRLENFFRNQYPFIILYVIMFTNFDFSLERMDVVMKCPYCAHLESKVVDSRPAEEGSSIRRRRECLACRKRFTTYEIVESLPLMVIKRDGSRQAFDKNKLIGSMLKACEKRSVPTSTLERLAGEIEQSLQNEMEREVPSTEIGELVMEKLKDVDEVSYVRFASVYRQFKDINTFMAELTKLLEEK